MSARKEADSGRRRFLTGGFLTDRLEPSSPEPSSDFGVSILQCVERETDDDGVVWIDYALVNGGSERTNVFVYLRKEIPKRSVKVLHLGPQEVFRGSSRELGKRPAEEMFLEVEARSGANNQREVLKISKANSMLTATEEEM